jgi:DNA-binding NtrC family response regulator
MEQINKLFLVDDDTTYTFLTELLIIKSNKVKQVQVFNDARKAIDSLRSNIKNNELLPEVIFLDLNMPIMNGWDFLKEFKLIKTNLHKKIIIYIVTSSINPVDFEKAILTENVVDFIIKPITKEKFNILIEEAIKEQNQQ